MVISSKEGGYIKRAGTDSHKLPVSNISDAKIERVILHQDYL